MIKKYHQFILESLENNDIKEYFSDLIDNGFHFDIEDVYYEDKYSTHTKKNELNLVDYDRYDDYQLLVSGGIYYSGVVVRIWPNKNSKFEDLTLDFRSALSQIEASGLKIFNLKSFSSLDSPRSLDWTDLEAENISFLNNNIILHNEDGDEIQRQIEIYFYVDEEEKMSDSKLAEYYSWSNYEEESGKIFINVELSDLVECFCNSKSEYYNILTDEYNEDLLDSYRNGNYSPEPSELGQRYSDLSKENIIKLFNYIINKNGWELFLNYIPSELRKLPKDEFLEVITGYKQESNLCSIFSEIYEDHSEIIDEIRWMIGSHLADAHFDKNLEEIWDAFYDMVGKYIEYTEFNKNVKIKTKPYNIEQIENKKFVRIVFNNEWIVDSKIDLMHESVESIFSSWVSESIPDYEKQIRPRLSDYGKVDAEYLNTEISEIISNYK